MAPRPLTGTRPTRTWADPSPPRTWPEPDWSRTLHFPGDVHFGDSSPVTGTSQGLFATRARAFKEDLLGGTLLRRDPDHIQVGDWTEKGGIEPSHDTDADDWVNGNDADGRAVPGSWRTVIGNHDIPWTGSTSPGSASSRNGDTAAAVFGYPGTRNWMADFGYVRVIGVSPFALEGSVRDPDGGTSNIGATIILDSTALSYLDTQLAAANTAGKDCIIVAHAPLENTHEGRGGTWHPAGTGESFSSYEEWVHIYGAPWDIADADDAIRSILAARSRAKVWVSGHSHTIFGETDWYMTEQTVTSGRNIVCINASGIIYTGIGKEQYADELCSLFLTWKPAGSNNIELRVRNHGAYSWANIDDQKVHTVAVPA